MRDEAREVFENTIVPRDFDTVEIPFAGARRARAPLGSYALGGGVRWSFREIRPTYADGKRSRCP